MTPVQEPAAQGGPDKAVDRAVWERLRDAARKGQLLPEGALLLDELHELHPEWREQFG